MIYTKPSVALAVTTLSILVFPHTAYAYIDLGTGSYLLQILAATLLGALFSIKLYWQKIKTFINNLFTKQSPNANKPDDDQS